MKKRAKILLSVLCAVVILIGGGLAFTDNYFVNYALASDGAGGDQDDFVPTNMAYHEAAPVQKQLLIVEGVGHAESRETDSDLYWQTVSDFLQPYIQ